MARAASSFPVPLSPVMSTVVSVGAARAMTVCAALSFGLSPHHFVDEVEFLLQLAILGPQASELARLFEGYRGYARETHEKLHRVFGKRSVGLPAVEVDGADDAVFDGERERRERAALSRQSGSCLRRHHFATSLLKIAVRSPRALPITVRLTAKGVGRIVRTSRFSGSLPIRTALLSAGMSFTN